MSTFQTVLPEAVPVGSNESCDVPATEKEPLFGDSSTAMLDICTAMGAAAGG